MKAPLSINPEQTPGFPSIGSGWQAKSSHSPGSVEWIDSVFSEYKFFREGTFKINFYFTKKKALRFISHLDLMRLFGRAARRAELPLFISKGFSPHPKINIKRALKLGIESDGEEADILLTKTIPVEEFCKRMNEQLPEGIQIRTKD